jgi:hypothetical protein
MSTRRSLAAAWMILALTGCAGEAQIAPNVGNNEGARVGAASHRHPSKGGNFASSYSGHYLIGCFEFECYPVRFTGSGRAAFLGKSSEKIIFDYKGGGTSATLSTSKGDSITASLGGATCGAPVAYVVTGGTGKFSGASGTGTVSIGNCVKHAKRRGSYSDSWSGTLYY